MSNIRTYKIEAVVVIFLLIGAVLMIPVSSIENNMKETDFLKDYRNKTKINEEEMVLEPFILDRNYEISDTEGETLNLEGENTLMVRIDDIKRIAVESAFSMDIEQFTYIPGIWDEVFITFTGPIRIARTLILPGVKNKKVTAKIISNQNGILSGAEEVRFLLRSKIQISAKKEGKHIKKGEVIMTLRGNVTDIFLYERTILNVLQRMSGIATETRKYVKICKSINPKLTIAATRKTTPGFRKFEKKAVEIGGGESHRFGLYDEVMIKDNHIKLIGSVGEAIKKVREKIKDKIIEVEVENEEDAITAAKFNVDVIMLDNFDPKSGEIVTKKIREINPDILIEISGGVNPSNIKNYVLFADRISLGYLTHSVKSKDCSLEILGNV